ncbi:hypothetical protein TorRG33x02_276360 [Trema orientale]|uniref:Uncharacterized protein n=1 Tax=Trema orientale TaxID=63057 RepID=A0A2P5CQV4_TREOI|nr:hypothetical protein TorRG33x02_276360 [Trema orientale]
MESPNVDLDEVLKLCTSLNLDEDDGPVVEMSLSAYSENGDKLDLCLVGKILGNKLANKDGSRSLEKQRRDNQRLDQIMGFSKTKGKHGSDSSDSGFDGESRPQFEEV